MKAFLRLFISFILVLGLCRAGKAQSAPDHRNAMFKPPAVHAFLGSCDGTDSISVKEADTLITMPLQIRDRKKNGYSVSSYGFLYRRRGYIQDDKTGLYHITYTTVSEQFKTTPLPRIWIVNMKGSFQPGEQLHFFDLIASDNLGHLFYVPDLVINIK